MKALFGRTFTDIEELREATDDLKERGVAGSNFTVIREVELSDSKFR